MKNVRLNIMIAIWCVCVLASCSRDRFADLNTDPDAILTIPPEYQLSTGLLAMHNNGNERFYDLYLGIYYWSQTFTIGTGNAEGSYQASGNIGVRWNMFFSSVGNRLIDIKELIRLLPPERQVAYEQLDAIVDVPLAYYAWYTSDVYGSLPYLEGFKARYSTPPLLTPVYDTQEQLYATLDDQLKEAVRRLKLQPSVPQTSLVGFDIYFDGDPVKWIKAANSLRLKMAMRLMHRNPQRLREVAAEVLNDEVGVIANDSESWKFIAGPGFTGTGDNPANQRPVSGSKNMVDFMWKTADPRIRIFYMPSHFTEERYEAARAQGAIPGNKPWDGQLYRGQFISPDASLDTANAAYFSAINYQFNGAPVTGARLPSSIRPDYFNATPNNGNITFPLISCSDVLFMRAELAQRGIFGSQADAQTWYYRGIDSALVEHDRAAVIARIPGYVPLRGEEASFYKAQPGVMYNQVNALEQICVQQYINYFKNNSEAWAIVKRTGFPSVSGNIMKSEVFLSSGVSLSMPRRFSISRPFPTNQNAENINNAIDAMIAIPGFGTPNDVTGRVWWDMQ